MSEPRVEGNSRELWDFMGNRWLGTASGVFSNEQMLDKAWNLRNTCGPWNRRNVVVDSSGRGSSHPRQPRCRGSLKNLARLEAAPCRGVPEMPITNNAIELR